MTATINDMLALALLAPPVASVLYSFSEAHLPGKVVIGILVLFSIFAWTIMFTKFGEVARARRLNRQFVEAFRAERRPLDLFDQRVRVEGCSLYEIYIAGCKELRGFMRGNGDGHGSGVPLSLAPSDGITLKQMDHVKGVIERTVAEQSLKLEAGVVLLATAVSGGPFLGLLGTVWGVMDAFGEIAIQGNASLTTMAPGVSGALITTVTGLLVAIPSMFGYNWLVSTILALRVELDNFASDLASALERQFVRE